MHKKYIFVWLMLSMPVRFVLYALHVYMQNVIALIELVRDALILLHSLMERVCSCIYRMCNMLEALVVISCSLYFIYTALCGIAYIIEAMVLLLRFPSKMLIHVGRLFRISAYGRTWVMMLRTNRAGT